MKQKGLRRLTAAAVGRCVLAFVFLAAGAAAAQTCTAYALDKDGRLRESCTYGTPRSEGTKPESESTARPVAKGAPEGASGRRTGPSHSPSKARSDRPVRPAVKPESTPEATAAPEPVAAAAPEPKDVAVPEPKDVAVPRTGDVAVPRAEVDAAPGDYKLVYAFGAVLLACVSIALSGIVVRNAIRRT